MESGTFGVAFGKFEFEFAEDINDKKRLILNALLPSVGVKITNVHSNKRRLTEKEEGTASKQKSESEPEIQA